MVFHIPNTKKNGEEYKERKSIKKLRRWVLFVLILFFLPIAGEGIYFLLILNGTPDLEKADLRVEFEGWEGRAEAAYRLADCGYASAMLISPADEKKLDTYDRIYKPRNRFQRVIETKAQTTFENALFTSDIIKEMGAKSVILVTSWEHMPRSYLLLSMMLAGSDVRIYPHSVDTSNVGHKEWYRISLAWKMVYNEMVETWGSLIEWANYRLSGRIPQKSPGKSRLFGGLKTLLLFDIDADATTSSGYIPE